MDALKAGAGPGPELVGNQLVAAPRVLQPAGQGPQQPDDALIDPNGDSREEENQKPDRGCHEQQEAKADEEREKKNENGDGYGHVAEGVTDDGGLIHWNPINSQICGSGCRLPFSRCSGWVMRSAAAFATGTPAREEE